jgi:DNA-binding MarR family transcriptional regulator
MDDKTLAADALLTDEGALDFGVLPELVGYHLRRAQVHFFADFVRTMAEAQVTPGQFGVLSLIGANPGMTQSALARAVGIERSTMVAVIDALQSRGLVERAPSPVDRRSYALVLTDQGKALLEQLVPMVRGHERRLMRKLTSDEREQLIRLLSKLID